MAEKSLYMLLGPEKGEKENYLTTLEKNLKKKLKEKPEKYRFYPFDTDISQIVSILRNGSLFASHKLALILCCEEIKKAADIKMLSEFCKNMPGDVTLVFLSDEVTVDKRLGALIPASQKKIFWEMFENQKQAWVQRFFSGLDLSIDTKAVNTLLEMVENNTADLKEACQTLGFYFKPGGRIREEDVDTFVYHSKEENVFTLFEKMLERDLPGSLEVLGKIISSGESDPVYLLAGLLRQIRRGVKVKTAIKEGADGISACLAQGIRGKKNQKNTLEGIGRFSLTEWQTMQRKAQELDRLLREMKKDMQMISFQFFLFKVLQPVEHFGPDR